jgi:uncharacterized membrane protein YtjA (UPF0391 family)
MGIGGPWHKAGPTPKQPLDAGMERANVMLRITKNNPATTMLHWSLVFLVIALVAAVLGFSGIAGASANIAYILFGVFLVLWLVSMLIGRGRKI